MINTIIHFFSHPEMYRSQVLFILVLLLLLTPLFCLLTVNQGYKFRYWEKLRYWFFAGGLRLFSLVYLFAIWRALTGDYHLMANFRLLGPKVYDIDGISLIVWTLLSLIVSVYFFYQIIVIAYNYKLHDINFTRGVFLLEFFLSLILFFREVLYFSLRHYPYTELDLLGAILSFQYINFFLIVVVILFFLFFIFRDGK